MTTDLVHLITLPDNAAERLAIFTKPGGEGVQPWLDQITAHVNKFGMGDASTEHGRADIRALAFKVTKAKTLIEKTGKDLKDDQVKIPKLIDVSRNHAFQTLEKLAAKVRAPLTEWEEREERRRKDHEAAITNVALLSETTGSTNEIASALEQARATPVDEETCHEFADEYRHARDGAVRVLEGKLAAQQKIEADLSELAELREAQRIRDEQIAAQREAEANRQREAEALRAREIHSAEVARLAEERRAREIEEAEQRRIRDVRAAEEAAQRKAEEADRQRREEAERVQRAADARAADQEHRRTINKAAVSALIDGGMSEMNARRAIELIAQGKVPMVRITY